VNAPSVSHLLLVDISLILVKTNMIFLWGKTNMINTTSLRRVLTQYCASSGQMASEAKCSIFFSPNVDVHVKSSDL
jgi:hypothetical protein